MSSVEGRLFEEEEEKLEEKRQREGGEFEEEPKQQEVEDEDDDDDDPDFYEGDSDDDNGDDFTSKSRTIERAVEDDEPTLYLDEKEKERNCDKVPQCIKFQHEYFFGSPVFELFKVKLILNNEYNSHLTGKLYGAIEIETSPENPDPVSYYCVRKENAVPITLTTNNNINLTLSGPKTRPVIADDYTLIVNFSLKFNDADVFEQYGRPLENAQLFDDGHGNHTVKSGLILVHDPLVMVIGRYDCYIRRKLARYGNSSDAIRVAAYYGIFRTGAWATLDIKILKKGVSSFYGCIYARSCLLYSRIRLLSIQSDQKRELQASESVELLRSVVAVPTISSLIISAELYDQDDNLIVRGKTFFAAEPKGSDFKYIGNDDVVSIRVNWACR